MSIFIVGWPQSFYILFFVCSTEIIIWINNQILILSNIIVHLLG